MAVGDIQAEIRSSIEQGGDFGDVSQRTGASSGITMGPLAGVPWYAWVGLILGALALLKRGKGA